MGLTNLVVTVAAVGAVIMLARTDIQQSASIFRRNVRHIRTWLVEDSVVSSKSAEKGKPKELGNKKDGSTGNKD